MTVNFRNIYDSALYRMRRRTYQRKMREFIGKSQYWTKKDFQSFQREQMVRLLTHAYQNVPYYQKLFREISFSPEDVTSLDDIYGIPLLDKKTVRDNWANLCATNIPKRSWGYFNTGGSTGTPLAFCYEKARSDLAERAFIERNWSWVGYRPGDRMVQVRGHAIPGRKICEFSKQNNVLYLSSYAINERNMGKYVSYIREFNPLYFHVYPSTIELFAKYMRANNVSPFPGVKAIFCSSENMYPFQRELIEEVFNARVFCHYGLAEHVALATDCEKSSEYHLVPEYAFNWLVDDKGQVVTEKGRAGEIVGTSFYNYVMPLINYRTGDIATLSLKDSCECGRQFRLLSKIDGRTQDLIILSDGTKIPLTALIFGQHFRAFENILRMQVIQEREAELLVKIVKSGNYTEDDEREISTKILDSVNGLVMLFFEYVSDIERTERGKHMFFISRLNLT